MTDRTFEQVKCHAADLWQREYDDQTPGAVFPLNTAVMMLTWLGHQGFPTGDTQEVLDLCRACAQRARGLQAARSMVERATGR